jgi:hypothetical protein
MLKEYAPQTDVPRNVSYMSSSYTFLKFAQSYVPADCLLFKHDAEFIKASKDMRERIEAAVTNPHAPKVVMLEITASPNATKQLSHVRSSLVDSLESKGVLVVSKHQQAPGAQELHVGLRKDKVPMFTISGPEALITMLKDAGVDFHSEKLSRSISIHLSFKNDVSEVDPVISCLALFLSA